MDSLKLPPEPSQDVDFSLWKKDVILWSKLTDTKIKKRGRALQYSCRNHERLREIVLNIDDKLIDCKKGLENVLKIIGEVIGKSDEQIEREDFQNFINMKMTPAENFGEFFKYKQV